MGSDDARSLVAGGHNPCNATPGGTVMPDAAELRQALQGVGVTATTEHFTETKTVFVDPQRS